MRLLTHKTVEGVIRCVTGLRIGGAKESGEIGGQENPVIRNPVTGVPYVPGSSLKGKLRSLLEVKYGKSADGKPCGCGRADCFVCTLFGCGDVRGGKSPTRLIFRDAFLTEASERQLREASLEQGINYVETKTEVMIDRRTNKVYGGALRTQERVPEGAEFGFEISVRVFEGDDPEETKRYPREGFQLMEADYLGGSGTRGYGKIQFKDVTFAGELISISGE